MLTAKAGEMPEKRAKSGARIEIKTQKTYDKGIVCR